MATIYPTDYTEKRAEELAPTLSDEALKEELRRLVSGYLIVTGWYDNAADNGGSHGEWEISPARKHWERHLILNARDVARFLLQNGITPTLDFFNQPLQGVARRRETRDFLNELGDAIHKEVKDFQNSQEKEA